MSISSFSAAAFLLVATAAAATESPAGTHACAALADPAERLACYDDAFPPASGAAAASVPPEVRKAQALQKFGLNPEQLREREPEATRDLQPDRIEAIVASMTERGTGERVVTLENGQVWLLTEKTSKGHLKTGDRIAIRKAALGTYMLLTPARIPLRARRLK